MRTKASHYSDWHTEYCLRGSRLHFLINYILLTHSSKIVSR